MAFAALAECLVDCGQEDALTLNHLIVDSMPISLAKLCRADRAKVAQELCAKTYNPSRKEWYYGLKLHAVVKDRYKKLPVLAAMLLSPANEHDLPGAKQAMQLLDACNTTLYGDKAFVDAGWAQTLLQESNIILATPHKRTRGEQVIFHGGDVRDSFISSIRQKIELFFNWLQDKTGIHLASKVRSLKGLLSHVFGKLAAALAAFFLF